ncbi:MAG: hypothetical protein ABH883_05910 [Candidatus Omnitrophota bacterium]
MRTTGLFFLIYFFIAGQIFSGLPPAEALSVPPAAQNPSVKSAIWIDFLLKNKHIVKAGIKEQELLRETESLAILGKNGQCVVSPEIFIERKEENIFFEKMDSHPQSRATAVKNRKLIRAFIHERLEAILQIFASREKEKYERLCDFFVNTGLSGAYKKFIEPDIDEKIHTRRFRGKRKFVISHIIAFTLELYIVTNENFAVREDLSPGELALLDMVRTQIDTLKSGRYLGESFFSTGNRQKYLNMTLFPGFRYEEAASFSGSGGEDPGRNREDILARIKRLRKNIGGAAAEDTDRKIKLLEEQLFTIDMIERAGDSARDELWKLPEGKDPERKRDLAQSGVMVMSPEKFDVSADSFSFPRGIPGFDAGITCISDVRDLDGSTVYLVGADEKGNIVARGVKIGNDGISYDDSKTCVIPVFDAREKDFRVEELKPLYNSRGYFTGFITLVSFTGEQGGAEKKFVGIVPCRLDMEDGLLKSAGSFVNITRRDKQFEGCETVFDDNRKLRGVLLTEKNTGIMFFEFELEKENNMVTGIQAVATNILLRAPRGEYRSCRAVYDGNNNLTHLLLTGREGVFTCRVNILAGSKPSEFPVDLDAGIVKGLKSFEFSIDDPEKIYGWDNGGVSGEDKSAITPEIAIDAGGNITGAFIYGYRGVTSLPLATDGNGKIVKPEGRNAREYAFSGFPPLISGFFIKDTNSEGLAAALVFGGGKPVENTAEPSASGGAYILDMPSRNITENIRDSREVFRALFLRYLDLIREETSGRVPYDSAPPRALSIGIEKAFLKIFLYISSATFIMDDRMKQCLVPYEKELREILDGERLLKNLRNEILRAVDNLGMLKKNLMKLVMEMRGEPDDRAMPRSEKDYYFAALLIDKIQRAISVGNALSPGDVSVIRRMLVMAEKAEKKMSEEALLKTIRENFKRKRAGEFFRDPSRIEWLKRALSGDIAPASILPVPGALRFTAMESVYSDGGALCGVFLAGEDCAVYYAPVKKEGENYVFDGAPQPRGKMNTDGMEPEEGRYFCNDVRALYDAGGVLRANTFSIVPVNTDEFDEGFSFPRGRDFYVTGAGKIIPLYGEENDPQAVLYAGDHEIIVRGIKKISEKGIIEYSYDRRFAVFDRDSGKKIKNCVPLYDSSGDLKELYIFSGSDFYVCDFILDKNGELVDIIRKNFPGLFKLDPGEEDNEEEDDGDRFSGKPVLKRLYPEHLYDFKYGARRIMVPEVLHNTQTGERTFIFAEEVPGGADFIFMSISNTKKVCRRWNIQKKVIHAEGYNLEDKIEIISRPDGTPAGIMALNSAKGSRGRGGNRLSFIPAHQGEKKPDDTDKEAIGIFIERLSIVPDGVMSALKELRSIMDSLKEPGCMELPEKETGSVPAEVALDPANPGNTSLSGTDLRKLEFDKKQAVDLLCGLGTKLSKDLNDKKRGRVFVIRYNADIFMSGKRAYEYDACSYIRSFLKRYVEKILPARFPGSDFELKPSSDPDVFISAECFEKENGKKAGRVGSARVGLSVAEGTLDEYFPRLTGILNIAMAASGIPDDVPEAMMEQDDYYRFTEFIITEYQAITGGKLLLSDAISKDTITHLKNLILVLPASGRMVDSAKIIECYEVSLGYLMSA